MNKFILSIFVIITLASCNEKKEVTTDLVNIPATASSEIVNGNLPKFEFKRKTFDFGAIKAGEVLSHTFKFKNVGNADLIITNVASSCGCTVPKYSKDPLKPGSEGFIEVIFDSSGRTGMQHKTVTVIANTQPNKVELAFTAEIIVN